MSTEGEAYGEGVGRYGVVVLAGGAGRRLGGVAKPALAVAGQPMVTRVLGAVGDAVGRVVVGPASLRALVPDGVRVVQEEPAGGGPVAGLAAGLHALTGSPGAGAAVRGVSGVEVVAVLAADLPLLTPAAVGRLLAAVGGRDGAVFVDDGGRQQWLCGAWSVDALARGLTRLAETGPLAGRSMRELVAPLSVAGVAVDGPGPPPWYDCDTPAALAAAESELGGG